MTGFWIALGLIALTYAAFLLWIGHQDRHYFDAEDDGAGS